jgi:hypothetical protein
LVERTAVVWVGEIAWGSACELSCLGRCRRRDNGVRAASPDASVYRIKVSVRGAGTANDVQTFVASEEVVAV